MVNRNQRITPMYPSRRRSPMARLVTTVFIVLAIVIGALYFFSTLAREQPLTRIEQPVANEAAAQ